MNSKQVVKLMAEHRLLSQSQCEAVLQQAESDGKTIERILVGNGLVAPEDYYRIMADAFEEASRTRKREPREEPRQRRA